jgi:hypothetical protein
MPERISVEQTGSAQGRRDGWVVSSITLRRPESSHALSASGCPRFGVDLQLRGLNQLVVDSIVVSAILAMRWSYLALSSASALPSRELHAP